MSQSVTLKSRTIRAGDLALPMKYVQMVVQSVNEGEDMTPVITAGDDTVLVVRIPGKETEQLVLDWIAEKKGEQESIPLLPPPPSHSNTPVISGPLLHFGPE